MLFMHPQLASVSCADCSEYVYDLSTGKVQTYEGPDDEMLPVLRHGTPTPCQECPRGGPENESSTRLSVKNYRLYDFYRRAKATPGFKMPAHLDGDRILQSNFALIDRVIEESNEAREMKRLSALVRANP